MSVNFRVEKVHISVQVQCRVTVPGDGDAVLAVRVLVGLGEVDKN
jgi:hypothetical protein